MIRAIHRNGRIHPLDPLPAEWTEGREVIVEDAASASSDDPEEWYRELQELGPARYEPGEWERVQATLAEAGELAKAMVRRRMGPSDESLLRPRSSLSPFVPPRCVPVRRGLGGASLGALRRAINGGLRGGSKARVPVVLTGASRALLRPGTLARHRPRRLPPAA